MSQIFFSAWDPQTPLGPLISPLELWVTDGTAAGVRSKKNIFAAPYDPNTTDGGSDPDQLTAGALMFFTANDGVHGRELWASDGTTAGTVMLRDIHPDQSFIFSGPTSLTAANGRLYFAVDDFVHGYELWTSDGTPSGTVMVTDIDGTQNGSLGGAIGSMNGIVTSSPGTPCTATSCGAATAPRPGPSWSRTLCREPRMDRPRASRCRTARCSSWRMILPAERSCGKPRAPRPAPSR